MSGESKIEEATRVGMASRQVRAAITQETVPSCGLGVVSAVSGALVELQPPVQHMRISWPQFLGGMLSDYLNPAVILAFLTVIYTWLASTAPITSRAVVTVIVAAIIAAMQAVLHATQNDGLARRLKAMGQLRQ